MQHSREQIVQMAHDDLVTLINEDFSNDFGESSGLILPLLTPESVKEKLVKPDYTGSRTTSYGRSDTFALGVLNVDDICRVMCIIQDSEGIATGRGQIITAGNIITDISLTKKYLQPFRISASRKSFRYFGRGNADGCEGKYYEGENLGGTFSIAKHDPLNEDSTTMQQLFENMYGRNISLLLDRMRATACDVEEYTEKKPEGFKRKIMD